MSPIEALKKYKDSKLVSSNKAEEVQEDTSSENDMEETPTGEAEMHPKIALKQAVKSAMGGKDQESEEPENEAKIVISMNGEELNDPQSIVDALKSMPEILDLIKQQLLK